MNIVLSFLLTLLILFIVPIIIYSLFVKEIEYEKT